VIDEKRENGNTDIGPSRSGVALRETCPWAT
jgi:hypothetical protein